MIQKEFDQIGLADIQNLVKDSVPEGKTIEYKGGFYQLDSADKDVKKQQAEEMLKDISAFANTLGGDLIIGVDAKAGIPTKVSGIDVGNADALTLRISEIAQRGLEPRVGLNIRVIPFGSRSVLVIRVPRSIASPHRINYQGAFGPFWARNSAGCYQMDTFELRQAFGEASSIQDRMKHYRENRIEAIKSRKTPIGLEKTPKVVCHLIPLDAFTSRTSFTIPELLGQFMLLRLIERGSGRSPKVDLDGLVVCPTAQPGPEEYGYVYAARNGIVEAVNADIIHYNPGDVYKTPVFKHGFVPEIIETVRSYLKALSNLGVAAPIYFALTLLDVKWMQFYTPGFDRIPGRVERDNILLPEVELCDLTVDVERALLSSFDMLWNAGGHSQCPMFSVEGKYVGMR